MLTKEQILEYHNNALETFNQFVDPAYEIDGLNMFLQLKTFGIGDMPEDISQLTEEQAARICQMAFAVKMMIG